MEEALTIIFIGAVVFLAHFFSAMFERTRIPDVLYLIGLGILVGPVFRFVTPDDFGKVGFIFTIIALVVILFEGGLEMKILHLRQLLRRAMFLASLTYVLATAAITALVAVLSGLPTITALFVGAVLAAPAPTVIFPMARQLPLSDRSRMLLFIEAPVGEAISIVVALGILQAIQAGIFHIGKISGDLISSFLLAVVLGLIGAYFWSALLGRIRKFANTLFTTPSFVFILYGICEFFGFSGPIATLTFGFALANMDKLKIPAIDERFKLSPVTQTESEKAFIGEIGFLIRIFFFVYLGLLIRITDVVSLLNGLVLAGVLLATRITALAIAGDKSTLSRQEASLVSTLIPKGTAVAVLGSLPFQLGIAGGETVMNVIYGAVPFSILFSSLGVFLVEKTSFRAFFHKIFGMYPENQASQMEETAPET